MSLDPAITPCDEEAETALAAAAIVNPSRTFTLAASVSESDFWIDKNRAIWTATRALYAKSGNFDLALLTGYLRDHNLIEKCGGIDYLRSLGSVEFVPDLADAYADRIRTVAFKRDLNRSLKAAAESATNGVAPTEIAKRVREEIAFLSDSYEKDKEWGFLEGDDLVAQEDEKIVHYWPGLVAEGHVLLLAGTAKSGKSWLTYGFIGALSRGEEWLGHATALPVTALIVSEEPKSRVRSKLRRFGVKGATILARGTFPASATLEQICEKVAKIALKKGHKIVLFDTFSGLARIENENDSGEINRAFAFVLDLAGRHNFAVVVNHHAPNSLRRGVNKPAKFMRAVDFVRGSSALQANPDAIAGLDNDSEEPDGAKRVLVAEGRFDLPPLRVVIQYHAPGHDGTPGSPATYTVIGSPVEIDQAREATKTLAVSENNQRRVLDLLNREAPKFLSKTAIREMLDAGSWVNSVLPSLYADGKIERQGDGARANPYTYGKRLGTPFS